MGSPDFAIPSLKTLLREHEAVGVVTQPDRPAGRGRRLAPCPVKTFAQEHALPLLQPERLREPGVADWMRSLSPDVVVVVAFGQLLPPSVLSLPRLGCINVHASLLPQHRGAAPIQRAILNGDSETGVSIMLMEEGLDTGPILLRERIPISDDDTAGTLSHKLAELGAQALLRALRCMEDGSGKWEAQDHHRATLAPKIRKNDARIDFTKPAASVRALVRAMDPEPGPWTTLDGQVLRLFGAIAVEGNGSPGVVLPEGADGLRVACGKDAVKFSQLQAAGKRRMSASDFLRGHTLPSGTRLGP